MATAHTAAKTQAAPGGISPREAWALAESRLPEVRDLLLTRAVGDDLLGQAARHHLESGGKAFRARLTLACAASLGVDGDGALRAAAACELLHNASLVHDDLQDKDATRRGRPSVWAKFGSDAALCLGDHFLAQSYDILSEIKPATAASQLIRLLAQATSAAVRGQLAEADSLDAARVSPADYEAMVGGKSGALFALPVLSACALAGLSEATRSAASEALYGYGVAYQIKDDLADILGGKEGRPAGTDLQPGQANAVIIHHLYRADAPTQAAWTRDITKPMDAATRAAWLKRLTTPATLDAVLAHRAEVLVRCERAAALLPPGLRSCLELGLSRIVSLPENMPATVA